MQARNSKENHSSTRFKIESLILKATRDHLEKSHPNTSPRRKHRLRGVEGLAEVTQPAGGRARM